MAQRSKPSFGVGINWAHPLANGLAAFWLLNEQGAIIADATGNGNNGSISGTVPLRSPDGVSNWGTAVGVVPHSAALNTDTGTVAASIQQALSGTHVEPIEKWGGGAQYPYLLRVLATSGFPQFAAYDNNTQNPTAQGSVSVADNWPHVLMGTRVWHGAMVLYVDGVVAATTTDNTTAPTTNTYPVSLGNRYAGTDPVSGTLRFAARWSRVLSAAEAASFAADPYQLFARKPLLVKASVAGAATGAAGEGEGVSGTATVSEAATGTAGEGEGVSGSTGLAPITATGSAGEGQGASGSAAVYDGAPPTLIQIENARAGTTAWQLTNPAQAREIEGYCSATSVARGSSIDLKINCADAYNLDVYRMGWYGGQGARLVTGSIAVAATPQSAPVLRQPAGTTVVQDLVLECGWTTSYTLSVPATSDWLSGIYVVKMTVTSGANTGKDAYLIFAVRDDARTAELLYIQPVTTYNAYNVWGAKDLYDLGNAQSLPIYGIDYGYVGPARRVSFDRPYTTFRAAGYTGSSLVGSEWGIGAGDFFTMVARNDAGGGTVGGQVAWEFDLVQWIERNGYDVQYCTSVDQDANGATLLAARGRRAVLSVGHDEYHSAAMRQALVDTLADGVGFAFLGANTSYWRIRLEANGSSVAARTVTCYKVAASDPFTPTTYQWSAVGAEEGAIVGTEYVSDHIAAPLIVATSASSHWVFAGTGVADGDVIGTELVGYEYDGRVSATPAGAVTLCHNSSIGHDSIVYQHASGAWVFTTGTMQFSWALNSHPYFVPAYRPEQRTPIAGTMLRNVFAMQGASSPTIGVAGEGQGVSGSATLSEAATGSAGEGQGVAGSATESIAASGSAGEGEGAAGTVTASESATGTAGEAEGVVGFTGTPPVTATGTAGEGEGAAGAATLSEAATAAAGEGEGISGTATPSESVGGTAGEGESVAGTATEHLATAATAGEAEAVTGTATVTTPGAPTPLKATRVFAGPLIRATRVYAGPLVRATRVETFPN